MNQEPASSPRGIQFQRRRRWRGRDIAPLVTLIVLVAFFLAVAPRFRRAAAAEQVLAQGAVMAVVSVGLTYVLLCAEIDLSVGALALWTAYACGLMFERFAVGTSGEHAAAGWAVGLVIAVPLASSLLLGLISGSLTVWARLPSFIITLAMMSVAEGIARFTSGNEKAEVPELLTTVGNRGIELTDRLTLPYSALLAGAVFVVGHVVLEHTRFGRYVYMTGGNREAARLAGVRTGAIVVACMAISAVTAGVGGLINAGRLNGVTMDQNSDLLLSAVACVVLGGTSLFGGEGGIGRTLVDVLTFSVLRVGLNAVEGIDENARMLVMGLVLLLALVVNGLLAKHG